MPRKRSANNSKPNKRLTQEYLPEQFYWRKIGTNKRTVILQKKKN